MLLKVEMEPSMDWDNIFTSLLEKHGFLQVFFVNTTVMNITGFISQQCCKRIAGTGMTSNGTVHTE